MTAVRRILAGIYAVAALFFAVGTGYGASLGTDECQDAGQVLHLWVKETAKVGPLSETHIREGGRDAVWYVGDCLHPFDPAHPNIVPYGTQYGGQKTGVWKTVETGPKTSTVRFPADPGSSLVTVYRSPSNEWNVKSEDELLFFAKQWPHKGWAFLAAILAVTGIAGGVYSLGLVPRRRIPLADLATSPRGAFPVG
jgi:hypothetical protein